MTAFTHAHLTNRRGTLPFLIEPAEPGFRKVRIRLEPGYMTSAEGDVSSPYGIIHVQWEIKDGKLQKSCRLPKGMTLLEGEEV